MTDSLADNQPLGMVGKGDVLFSCAASCSRTALCRGKACIVWRGGTRRRGRRGGRALPRPAQRPRTTKKEKAWDRGTVTGEERGGRSMRQCWSWSGLDPGITSVPPGRGSTANSSRSFPSADRWRDTPVRQQEGIFRAGEIRKRRRTLFVGRQEPVRPLADGMQTCSIR